MKKGNLLVMFPEGTRKNHGSMVKIERGVGLLAIRANVIIVPANISGSYRLFGRLRVKFGEPSMRKPRKMRNHSLTASWVR